MKNFEKIVNTSATIQRMGEINEQEKEIKNSNLTDEQKTRALISEKKMIKTTIIFVLIVCLFMGISMIYGLEKGTDEGLLISGIGFIVSVVVLIIYALSIKKLFPDWAKYYNLVDKGFDRVNS